MSHEDEGKGNVTSYAKDDVDKRGGNHRSGRVRVISPDIGIYPAGFDRPAVEEKPVAEAMKSSDESFGLRARPGILDPNWDAKNGQVFPDSIHSWHVHHYFEDGNEESIKESLELRDLAIKTFPNITIGKPFRSGAIVHPVGFWVLECHTPAEFNQYLPWLLINHGQTNALVHMNTHWELAGKVGGEYVDHTDQCFWIGNPRDIPKLADGVEKRFYDVISKDAKIDPVSHAKFKANLPGARGYFAKGYSAETNAKIAVVSEAKLNMSPAQENVDMEAVQALRNNSKL